MENQRIKILYDVSEGKITPLEAEEKLSNLDSREKNGRITMEKFHRIISKSSPDSGYEAYLKHLWMHNSAKRIFTITGLDVSRFMIVKEDTSGIRINKPSYINHATQN